MYTFCVYQYILESSPKCIDASSDFLYHVVAAFIYFSLICVAKFRQITLNVCK